MSVSAPIYALTVFGFAVWLAYSPMKDEWPIVITNAVCLSTALILRMTVLQRANTEASHALSTREAAPALLKLISIGGTPRCRSEGKDLCFDHSI